MSFGEQFNSNITWIQREYYKDFAIISNNNNNSKNQYERNDAVTSNESLSSSAEKPKRSRTVYLRSQLIELEKEFRNEIYLRHNRTVDIAKRLGLSKRQVKVWFQNRRMKENRKKEPNIVNSAKSTNKTAQGNIVQRLMSYAQAEVEKQRVCVRESLPILSIPEWTVPPPNEIKTLLENV